MANALSLTDGTTTISLSSSGCFLTHYVPDGPEMQPNGEYKPITETVEFVIQAASTALVQEKLNAIERLLTAVNRRIVNRTGAKPYLLFQVTGDAVAQRSELLGYRITLEADAAVSFAQLSLGVRLIVTRVPFWEGARTAIPLSNGNGAGVVSGLTVKNHDDGTAGNDNWCDIASASIAGSLPSPIEIRMENNTGANRTYRNFYVSNNPWGVALPHIIQGESVNPGYGTVYTDANCSNGNYVRQTGAGWVTFRWAIPTATLSILSGRYVRVLARFRTLGLPSRKAALWLWDPNSLVPLSRSPNTLLRYGATEVQDCGALAIPAVGYSQGWDSVNLELGIFTPSSESVEIDFIQLTPTEPTLFRRLTQVAGYLQPVPDAVVDDGIEELSYYEDGVTSLRYPIYVSRNEPVHVWPGVDQRLLILHDGTGHVPAWTLSVKAWYRPRRTLL